MEIFICELLTLYVGGNFLMMGGREFSLGRLIVALGIVAATCIAVLSIPQVVSAAPSGWEYERPITLTPATPVADYQVKIELTTSNFDYSKARSDGGDIRFYDPGNNR
jgi:hypothetical protein